MAMIRRKIAIVVAWLTYRHLGPDGRLQNILDSYAYNSTGSHHQGGSEVVTDLCLRAPVTLGQPGAAVIIEMRAYKDRLRFELTAEGSDQPTCIYVNGAPAAKSPRGVLPVGRGAEVLAANVDHKLMLLVDGRQVATETALQTPEGDVTYTPTPLTEAEREWFDIPSADKQETLAAEVRIGVRGGPAKIAHLRLDRDVYYVNEAMMLSDGSGMAPGHGTEGNPFTLKEGEYFVLGDNSPRSFDSRLWDLPRPVVPQDFIIGRAIFVQSSAGTRWIP
jgi:signal peptidase I